jgi:hypothetical protein
MVPIISAVMVMMSPVRRTVPVVPGSHDDGRGIHDRQWWGDEHGYGSDENRDR